MSGESSTTDPTQNLSLTPEEKRLYGQLFRQADFDNVGVVTGETAVSFFEKTRLDRTVLGKIWQISDTENRGFLTPAGFSVALRLLGHAQAGRDPTPELARQSGPLPQFDGVALPTATPTSPPPPAAVQPQGTGGGPVRIPPLTPDKAAQYASIFERQPLLAGNLMPGDQAKQIFERSGLPNETLGLVWQLVDTEQRGALIASEFVIAMHLLNAMKVGALKAIPSTLPPALVEAANRRGPAPRQSPTATGTLSAIPRQLSGSAQLRTGSPLGRHATIAPQPSGLAGGAGAAWAITPAEKAKFDTIYDDLDKTKRGFITGEEAVPFFSQSNLSAATLAQIWDLADINSEGVLNKDEFAIAMYLIRQQRASRDGTAVLPTTLPPNLIPPSMRNQVRPPTATSPFDAPIPQAQPQPPPPAQKSALDDLFELDGPAATMQAPLTTGGSAASDPFSSGPVPTSPVRASPTASQFRPFVPSSSFGKGLTLQHQQHTGDSKRGAGSEDLLGDADPEISAKLTNETTELANISNQIGTLTKQMTNLQTQRMSTQHDLTQASQQKKNFEQRLTQLRTLYEKEAKDVRALEEQLAATKSDTRKLQAECMSLEGTCQDLQNQKQQVVTALQADQQENASLKEKIRALNTEIAQLKPQIEKLKSEARQQKGLVAINKKQLSTNESERDRLKSEADELAKGGEELSRQMTGSSLQSGPAGISSPTPSAGSGNNPFFKRTASTDMIGAFASPPMKASDKSFDDIFGSPFPQASATPPPAASTIRHHTGNSTGSGGSFGTPATTSPNISRQATLNVEPPAPPESRQLSSSFLPLKDLGESLSSSRQVSPPLSRTGDDKGALGSPLSGAFSPLEPSNTGQSNTASAAEVKSSATGDSGNTSGPAAETPVAGAGTEEKKLTGERSVRDSDPFASMDQAKAKAEFDNAFASFTKIHKTQDKAKDDSANAFSTFNTEFPPISELERDESESDSEAGFDDDFAPSSPKGKDSQVTVKDNATALPAASAAKQEASDAFLAMIGDSAADKSSVHNNSNANAANNFFDSPLATTPTAVTTAPAAQTSSISAPPAPSKTPFDSDLDDDFEGLEDAKEGSADDDFANISRSGLDEFNSVFDSSPPTSQAKTESSTAFGGGESSFDFVGTLSTGSLGGVNNSSVTPTAATATTGAAAVTTQSAAGISASDAQDWDAMFSNLDSAASDSPKTAEAPKETATRPELSHAETGDDPLLKNLTSMGYSRTDALAALEKYDYDIERAANFLASSS